MNKKFKANTLATKKIKEIMDELNRHMKKMDSIEGVGKGLISTTWLDTHILYELTVLYVGLE